MKGETKMKHWALLLAVALMATLLCPLAGMAEEAKEPVEFGIMMKLYNEMPDLDNEYWTRRDELTNSKADIMFVPYGEYNTKRDLMLASGNLPDVVEGMTNEAIVVNYINQGVFWDFKEALGDFSNYPNLKPVEERGLFKDFEVNGGVYTMPAVRCKINAGLTIRKDLLDEAGLEVPTTVAEFTDAMRAVKALHPDIIGLIGHGPLIGDALLNFEPAFGCYDINNLVDEDGGVYYYTLSDEYLNMIEWLRQCYEEKLLAQEFTVIEVTQGMEIFNTGRAFSYGRNVYRCYDFEKENKKVNPDAECMILPPMKGEGDHYSVSLIGGVTTSYLINNAIDAEKKLRILDYFDASASDEMTHLIRYGIEGIHHNVVDGEIVMTERGSAEINATATMGTVGQYDMYNKSRNVSAGEEYNQKVYEWIKDYEELGSVSPFTYITSSTYATEWPKYQEEYETALVQAIIGDISMEELHEFAAELKENPALKAAWQEFAENAKALGML